MGCIRDLWGLGFRVSGFRLAFTGVPKPPKPNFVMTYIGKLYKRNPKNAS